MKRLCFLHGTKKLLRKLHFYPIITNAFIVEYHKFLQPIHIGPISPFQLLPLIYKMSRVDRMKTRLRLKPGQKGTKKLAAEYGDRLVCVRYRYDSERKKRVKTIELIIEEVDWSPKDIPVPDMIVGVRVAIGEVELQRSLRKAGARWNREDRVWNLPYTDAVKLGIEDRIVNRAKATS